MAGNFKSLPTTASKIGRLLLVTASSSSDVEFAIAAWWSRPQSRASHMTFAYHHFCIQWQACLVLSDIMKTESTPFSRYDDDCSQGRPR
jgi:hypothetical protein